MSGRHAWTTSARAAASPAWAAATSARSGPAADVGSSPSRTTPAPADGGRGRRPRARARSRSRRWPRRIPARRSSVTRPTVAGLDARARRPSDGGARPFQPLLKEVVRPMLWRDPFALKTSQLTRPAALVPALDVATSDDHVILTMDVPGFKSEELSIEVEDRYLTVRGERKRPHAADGTSYVHIERPFGAFERRITVPAGVDADRITASLDDGVLSLIVPKPQRLKPKAIAIDGGTQQRRLETTSA